MTKMARGGQWLTAEELSAVFIVHPDTLALYGARGTLPAIADERGHRRYDLESAATIFRRRGAATAEAPRGSFGRLGQVSLGAAELAPPSSSARFAHAGR